VIRRILALAIVFCAVAACAQSSGSGDPLLDAMRAEMERSKSQLKLENVGAPYYIEYRVIEMQTQGAQAVFGALQSNASTRFRFLRAVVRIGDYTQDSFFQQGEGALELMPLDNDVLSLRHQIWLATDKAYKQAAAARTQKEALLKQYNVEQPVDDFAKAEPVQSIAPLAKLETDASQWTGILQHVSSLYRPDPEIHTLESRLEFSAVNRYFMNSEGTVVRDGRTIYELDVAANTQAPDGMDLERSHAYTVGTAKELPTEQQIVGLTGKMLATLKMLRAAPVADEEYRGPVLFSADAAASVFADFVGPNVLGARPDPGQPARTKGAWASSYKSRVLPDFLSVVDDPSQSTIAGHSLLGHYDVDDEGVRAMKVQLIDNGKLMNYLMGREPIRDFPASNGHGRARIPANSPGPSLGNLIVQSSEPVAAADLKKKLLDICKQHDLPFGYYVETMGPRRSPRLLYRVYVSDGHEELVRGGTLGDLDTRALRNDLIAAGDDVNVENRTQNIPHSIVNPSILFDELEVRRANANKEKLPEYPPPPVGAQ
jgi:TldD protein